MREPSLCGESCLPCDVAESWPIAIDVDSGRRTDVVRCHHASRGSSTRIISSARGNLVWHPQAAGRRLRLACPIGEFTDQSAAAGRDMFENLERDAPTLYWPVKTVVDYWPGLRHGQRVRAPGYRSERVLNAELHQSGPQDQRWVEVRRACSLVPGLSGIRVEQVEEVHAQRQTLSLQHLE